MAFADDTAAKQGTALEGVPVVSLAEAYERWPDTALAVTMLNPQATFLAVQQRLAPLGWRVVSMPELVFAYADAMLPWLQLEPPERLLARADSIRQGLELLADEESRRQLVAHLRFRLWCDHAALPMTTPDQYFAADVLPPLTADLVFVDCGAYDGDTIRELLARQPTGVQRIYAFEPDPRSFGRLEAYLRTLSPQVSARIEARRAAVGARGDRQRFEATGDPGAALSSHGGEEVEVVALQEVVAFGDSPGYVKMDVEGAEAAALRGAELLLRRARPWLAVSVYHRPADLWELPRQVHAVEPRYRISLRTHGNDGMDIVAYAVCD